jgi:hypothetical protein
VRDLEAEALEIAIYPATGALKAMIYIYSVQPPSHVSIRRDHFLERFELLIVSEHDPSCANALITLRELLIGRGASRPINAIGLALTFLSVQVLKRLTKTSRDP